MSERLFLIVDHVVFVVVVVALAFAVDAAAAKFDDAISTDVAAVFLVVLLLFVVAAGASDFENVDGDFAIACYFFIHFC